VTRMSRRLLQGPAIALLLVIQAGCGGGSSSEPTPKYSVNATVSGLVGTGLVLALNAGGQVTVNSDSTVQFPTPLAVGSSYSVSIVAQPASPPQTCTLTGGTGTVTSASAPSVTVACAAPPYYQVGGTVSGLLGGPLTLQIDSPHLLVPTGASNQVTVESGGTTFAFTATVAQGSSYTATIVAQPTSPPQQCVLSGGSGTVTSSNVNSVVLTCAEPSDITAPNTKISVLHTFGQYDLVNALFQGTDGNLYGTAYQQGAASCGIVFQVTLTGVVTVLHSFAGGADDGCNPIQLLQGSDGNLYGMTGTNTATAGLTDVFKLTTAGVETILHKFPTDPAAPANPVINSDGLLPVALIQGGDGNLYGTTRNGGASGNGIVFQLSLTGVEKVLHSFAGGPTDGSLPGALVYGSDGSLYGVTYLGGSNIGGLNGPGDGAFYKVDASGTETVLYSLNFGQTAQGLSLGATGNFYFWGSGNVAKITASGAMTPLAGWCATQFCDHGGAGLGNFVQASDGRVYGFVDSYLGGFLANLDPSATAGNSVAYYLPTGSSAPSLLFEGTNKIFYGTDGTNILVITNLISP
jgi:uncharacterized repeat protein (TIGR03803 family)